MPGDSRGPTGPVVLLAGPGDTTDIVANYLTRHVDDLRLVVEAPPSRLAMARRRATRIGWFTVLGQVLFVALALPILRWQGRHRISEILEQSGLDATPYPRATHVPSVNDPQTATLLGSLHPEVVVVNGTRIISRSLLDALDCPIVNTHAGITPRFRGVHGGYWALVQGTPEFVGTTVHLVDPGIDTGGVLAQATFEPTGADTVATYPYLHLAAGLPLLADQLTHFREVGHLTPLPTSASPEESRLFLHPTLWQYVRHRVEDGVR